MVTIKLTSKRQATFPVETCKALGIAPGDRFQLESRLVEGERLWVLTPPRRPGLAWVGMFKEQAAKVKDHSMEAMRASIARGRAKEQRR